MNATVEEKERWSNHYRRVRRKGGVKDWLDFSLNERTEEEIKDKMLEDPDSVCISYVCKFSNLSSEFIEDMMALSTGIFTKETFTKENKDIVLSMLDRIYDNYSRDMKVTKIPMEDLISELSPDLRKRVPTNGIRDRMDWYYIKKYQHLDHWFIEKYQKMLDQITYTPVMDRKTCDYKD